RKKEIKNKNPSSSYLVSFSPKYQFYRSPKFSPFFSSFSNLFSRLNHG
uniref:Uncharacterized protein n=1 Tax=Solanum lycopersicum TaxID=4081 RepID=A0A3Q7FZG2_SOLLC